MRTVLVALSMLLTPAAALATQYAKVAVVALSGGDYLTPRDAMANLATWCRPPTDTTTPCLVKLMPGVYDNALAALTMKPYVDLEGSGELVTTITGSGPTTVSCAANSELRSLAIENTHTGSKAIAVTTWGADGFIRLRNVTVRVNGAHAYANHAVEVFGSGERALDHLTVSVSGSTVENLGVLVQTSANTSITGGSITASGAGWSTGVFRNVGSGRFEIRSTTIRATAVAGAAARGVTVYDASAWLKDSSVTAEGSDNVLAIASEGYYARGTVYVEGSDLTGLPYAVQNWHGDTYIANTRVQGLLNGGELTSTCVGAYDQNFRALATNCSAQ